MLAPALTVLNTGWIASSEMKTGVTEITISTLFIGVTFLLFLVTPANMAVGRLGLAALRQFGLMLLYSRVSVSSVVAGVGHIAFSHRSRPTPSVTPTTATAGAGSGTCCRLASGRATRPSGAGLGHAAGRLERFLPRPASGNDP